MPDFTPARVLSYQRLPGGMALLRLQCGNEICAARPGQFICISTENKGAMPIALPVSGLDVQQGWIECLASAHSIEEKLPLLPPQPLPTVWLSGPHGKSFATDLQYSRPLLIAEVQHMAPLLLLVQKLKREPHFQPVVLLGTPETFPFTARPSSIMAPAMPPGVIACVPLLEDSGIVSRLAATQGQPGCFEGTVIDLAKYWMSKLDYEHRQQIEVFACGNKAFLLEIFSWQSVNGFTLQTIDMDNLHCDNL